MDDSSGVSTTAIAILLDTCNKYECGKFPFRLSSLVGLKDNTTTIAHASLSKKNLLNKNRGSIPIGNVNTASTIMLEIPTDVARKYPVKFIPPGTRFIVTFNSGDITKPVIVGGEF